MLSHSSIRTLICVTFIFLPSTLTPNHSTVPASHQDKQLLLDEQLLSAAAFDDLAQVIQLLKEGARPNIHDAQGFTPLIYAARHGNLAMTKTLRIRGAKINAQDDCGDTPLKWSCFNGHKDVTEFLLAHKAKPNTRDHQGNTALMDAARRGYTDIVALLIAHNASINNENHKGETALSLAKAAGHTGVVLLLTAHKAAAGTQEEQAVTHMLNKLDKLPIPPQTKKEIRRIIWYIEQAGPMAGMMDHTLQPYLELIFALPWSITTTDTLDIDAAKKILDQDHYGLDSVKEKILDFIAVMNFKKNGESPIICLVGAPGIGKTSLGKSIARALGRKYVRISVGGMHDESEIRGHRRTYVGARPGRIVEAFKQAQSMNPVIVIDEIDKIGQQSHHGNPCAALLEVLDPEQNNAFRDNYLEAPLDISKALFITTANDISNIPTALRDRMEIIDLESYSTPEKIAIAQNHLITQALKECGLENKHISFSKEALEKIIESYAFEGGVRQLKRTIARILSKIARELLKEGSVTTITPADLKKYLGPEKYPLEHMQEVVHEDQVGIVNCLAALPGFGIGAFFKMEVLLVPRTTRDETLIMTGQIGPIAQESIIRAISFVRTNAQKLGIDTTLLNTHLLHINVSDKTHSGGEGPSAGIGQVVAIASALSNRKIKSNYAMTGATNLRGHVMPIGGLKEKITAAKKAGMKYVIVPADNKVDVEKLDSYVTDGIEIIFVHHVEEALKILLL